MEIRNFLEPIAWWSGPEDDSYIDHMVEYCYKLQAKFPEGDNESYSARHGWQLHELHKSIDQEMIWLQNMIIDKFMVYLEALEPKFKYHACMVNMFINILPPGGHNVAHVHPGCQFSGVFYLKGGEDCGNLTIFNPMSIASIAQNFCGFPRIENTMIFPPEPGKGLFFSNNLVHHVDTNRSDNDRISVAFNIRINDFLPGPQQ